MPVRIRKFDLDPSRLDLVESCDSPELHIRGHRLCILSLLPDSKPVSCAERYEIKDVEGFTDNSHPFTCWSCNCNQGSLLCPQQSGKGVNGRRRLGVGTVILLA